MEIYYAPTKLAAKISLAELVTKLSSAGLDCTMEEEGPDIHRACFNGSESTLLISVKDGAFVFGTFDVFAEDGPSIIEAVDKVMQGIGFSADEDADYI